jgi:hypothetical protein
MAMAMENALSTSYDRDLLRRRASDYSPELAADRYLKLFIAILSKKL